MGQETTCTSYSTLQLLSGLALFCSQNFHRVGYGCTDGLKGDCKERNC
jgi:hypothetical protein